MKLAPGPSSFWDLLKTLIKRQIDPMKFYQDSFKKYGDVVYIRMGQHGFLMLNDADAIEQVLQTDARIYTKSTAYERFRLIFGNGLLISSGELWKKQRRMIAGSFSSKNVERLHPLILQETLHTIGKWAHGTEVDLAEEMNALTLHIISKSMLGHIEEKDTVIIRSSVQNMLTYLQTSRHLWLQLLVTILPVKDKVAMAIKIESHLPLKSTKSFFESIKSIDEFVNKMIEERRRLNLNENLLDTMIKATDQDDQSTMTNQQLRDEVVNILIAGHETTSNALSWMFHQLLKYPDVYKKVTDEIRNKVEGATPTFEELSSLVYTQAVFQESMRLFPPFWRISRRATEATKVKGFDIPAGTNVIASIFTIQRSKDHWRVPEEFRPERFLAGGDPHHRFAYIPFGAGPRICIGSNLAMTEAMTILATCLKNFDFEKAFHGDPTFLLSLTMQPKEGCLVKIKKVER